MPARAAGRRAVIVASPETLLGRWQRVLRRIPARWRRPLAFGVAALAFTAAGVLVRLLGGTARASVASVASADPRWATLAGAGFVASLAATAFAWRRAFATLGAPSSVLDACARYAAGSLVNTVSPGRVGDGVRAAAFGRRLPQGDRLKGAAAAVAALAVTRGLVHAMLLACAVVLGLVPAWALVAGAVVGAVLVIAMLAGRRRLRPRFGPLLEAFLQLVGRPRVAAELVAWSLAATSGRVLAAGAIAASLGSARPLLAALAVIAALDLALVSALTPGGIGVTSAAVAVALAAHGLPTVDAVAGGLVFHAVETLATLSFAGASLPLATHPPARARMALRLGAALAAASVLASAVLLLDVA